MAPRSHSLSFALLVALFPDFAKAEGSDEEVMNVFRDVRHDIEQEMVKLLKEHS